MLLSLLVPIIFFALHANASHFRYMSLAWKQTSTLTYEFTVNLAYRVGSQGSGYNVCVEYLNYGDGSSDALCGTPTTVVDATGSSFDTFTIVTTHSYANLGVATANIASSARIAGLANGDQQSYQGQLVIDVGAPASSSPQISTTSTQTVAVNQKNVFKLPTTGGSGATTCSLTPTSISYLNSQPSANGKDISIASDCTVTFDLTGYTATGTYFGFSVTAADAIGNSATVDFLLITQAGTLPDCQTRGLPDGSSTLTVSPGEEATVFAEGSTADGAALRFGSQGLPSGATFVAQTPNNGVYSNRLDFTPTVADVGRTIPISFSYANPNNLQCVGTFYITVVNSKPKITICPTGVTEISESDKTCTLKVPDFTALTTYSGTGDLAITQTPVADSDAEAGSNEVIITVTNDQGSASCTTFYDCALAKFAPSIETCAAPVTVTSGSHKTCDQLVPNFVLDSNLVVHGTEPLDITQSVEAGSASEDGTTQITIKVSNEVGEATCQTSFTCTLADAPVCPPTFTKFPAMAKVELFADYSPASTGGSAEASSECCDVVHVTYTDSIFSSPACASSLAIHRLWTAKDTCADQSVSQLQMIELIQPKQPLFDAASPFQLYTVGTMTLSNSIITGQVATGCDLVSKNTIFGKSSACTYTGNTLVTDNFNLQRSQVYYGNAAYAVSYKADKQTQPLKAVHKSPLKFLDIQSKLKTQNSRLAAVQGKLPAGNYGSVSGTSGLVLSGSSTFYNVFSLTSAQLTKARTLRVKVPAKSLVLVNIVRPSGVFDWPVMTISTHHTNILFNFIATSKLTINAGTIKGSILAPQTHLTFGRATMIGQVAALTIDADRLQTKCATYIGNDSCGRRGGKYGNPYKPSRHSPVRRATLG